MQFFKYEGQVLCETWSQENDSRRAMHEKTRKIALKSDSFNQKLLKTQLQLARSPKIPNIFKNSLKNT